MISPLSLARERGMYVYCVCAFAETSEKDAHSIWFRFPAYEFYMAHGSRCYTMLILTRYLLIAIN
jgi:hypothetical protein